MTNRQSRIFAIASTAIAALIFLILTLDSHRQFPELTQSQNITPEVIHGKDVWHKYNCINCHTLFGEGAYYAPDLTKITDHRSEAYLHAYMKDPSKFYDEQKHRRLMPKQDLSDKEIEDLVKFLEWVANVDNQGWPPRPIMVTGGYMPDAGPAGASTTASGTTPGTTPVDEEDEGIAKGGAVYRSVTPGCNSCHSLMPGVDMAGPSLAGLEAKAESIIHSDAYAGSATSAEEYVKESILEPSKHIVPGGMYSSGGMSFMPSNYRDSLSDDEVDQIVDYLLSFK